MWLFWMGEWYIGESSFLCLCAGVIRASNFLDLPSYWEGLYWGNFSFGKVDPLRFTLYVCKHLVDNISEGISLVTRCATGNTRTSMNSTSKAIWTDYQMHISFCHLCAIFGLLLTSMWSGFFSHRKLISHHCLQIGNFDFTYAKS